jgi:hypothetical protein
VASTDALEAQSAKGGRSTAVGIAEQYIRAPGLTLG